MQDQLCLRSPLGDHLHTQTEYPSRHTQTEYPSRPSRMTSLSSVPHGPLSPKLKLGNVGAPTPNARKHQTQSLNLALKTWPLLSLLEQCPCSSLCPAGRRGRAVSTDSSCLLLSTTCPTLGVDLPPCRGHRPLG